MAGESQSVGGIGVALDIDTAGWDAGIDRARAKLETLTKAAQGSTISVPLGSRQSAQGGSGRHEGPPLAVSTQFGVNRSAVQALRVQTNQHLRTMAQGGQAVQVPITLGRVPYGQMRTAIAHGIGEIPVRVRLDPVGIAGIKSVLTAVLTQTAAGSRSSAGIAAGVEAGIPRRQFGGHVNANQPYLVGERRAEVFVPRTAGTILPHAMAGARVADRMNPGQLDFLGNLRAAASRIQPHHAAGGLSWYTDAGNYGRAQASKYGMEVQKAIGILAALSAGTSWTANKTKFERILGDNAAGKPFPYSMNLDAHRKAAGILSGSLTPKQAFASSPKVGQFFGGLMGDLSTLTLDRWATRTTTQGALDQPPKSMRPAMEGAWKKVAKEHGWSNAQFQAALWLLEKEESGQAPGQVGMFAKGGRVGRGGWGSVKPISEDWLNNLDRNKSYNKPGWDEALDPKYLTRFRGDPNDKGPGSGHVYTKPMDPWMYHVTRASNMDAILEEGVQPQRGGTNSSGSINQVGAGRGGPRPRTYWSRYPDAGWGREPYGRPGQPLDFNAPRRPPVALAARLSDIEDREFDEIGELASRRGVGPDKLHFLGADRRIHPLKHARQGLFVQADAETFASAIGAARASERHGRKIGETVYQYPTDEYRAMKTYLTKDHSSGYAIKPDGDLVSLFNAGGRGRGQSALRSAIQRGGSKLDAFDENGFLPGLYSKFGFREVGRDPWNPEYAPPEWRGGTPDVVYMQRLGKRIRDSQRARGGSVIRRNPKASQRTLYALRWPKQAENRHYQEMAEEHAASLYQPDWQGDNSEPWGSPMGEPRLWMGGTPRHRATGGPVEGCGLPGCDRKSGHGGPHVSGYSAFTMDREEAMYSWSEQDFRPGSTYRERQERRERERAGWSPVAHADTRDRIDKLKAMATQTEQSPNEAAIAKRLLHERGIPGYAGGGNSTKGLYIVNEIGKEKYVPKHLEGLIPPDVAAQIPGGGGLAARLARARGETAEPEAWMPAWRRRGMAKDLTGRANGGIIDINGPKQLWQAPGDGWIIPNRLINRIPHAANGIATRDAHGRLHSPVNGAWISEAQAKAQGYQIQPSEGSYAASAQRSQEIASARFLHDSRVGPLSQSVAQSRKLAAQFSANLDPRATALSDPEHLARFENIMELTGQRTAQRGLSGRSNIGGIFTSAFGGRGRTEARAQYAQASREYELLAPKGEDAITHFTERLDTATHQQIFAESKLKAMNEQLGVSPKRLKEANQAVLDWQDNVDKSNASLQNAQSVRDRADKALQRSQGGTLAQFGAIQFAGLSYQIGQQVAGFLASSAGSVMKPFLDTITGFQSTTARVTADLAKELPGVGGQTGILFAQQGIQAGLSAGAVQYLQQTLGASVNAKAAANAQGTKSDLFRAAAGVGNAPTGLDTGYGGLFGTSLFAQQLGGGKGFGEQISGDLSALGGKTPQGPDLLGNLTKGLNFLTDPNYAAGVNQASVSHGGPTVGQSINSGIGGTIQGIANSNPYAGLLLSNLTGAASAIAPQLSGATPMGVGGGRFDPTFGVRGDNLKTVNAYLKDLNDTAGRGAKALGQANTATIQFFKTSADQQTAKDRAVAAGNSSALSLAEQGFGVYQTGPGGKQTLATSDQINPAFAQIAQGTNIPDQAVVAAAARSQIKAQVAQNAASTAFSVGGAGSGSGAGGLIGGQFGLQLAANPFAAAGSGVAVNFQSKLAPQLKAVSDLQNKLSAEATSSITDMTQVVSQNMGSQAATQFTGYVDDITKTGAAIMAITSGLANQQAAVGAAQYGNSLRIINRSIRDAKGLVTGQGATSGPNANLGAVQRLQFTLQQQSEQLSIAQSQRQINFSVAAAGFQAPGQTGEQRAANIAEAKYEASIAQKQLNIQKQQVPLALTSFNVGATRSLVDLQAQKAINAQEYALSQEQVVAQKRVNALQMGMALSQQKAEKILDGAVGNWNSALSIAAQAAGQYGYELSGILKDIRTGIDQALGVVPSGSTSQKDKGAGQNKATGAIFNTRGATDITVGEAQTETVAILRNPRAGSLGAPTGGGSSAPITIMVTGNNVRSDSDLDALARRVQDAVERAMQSRGAMLGLRSF